MEAIYKDHSNVISFVEDYLSSVDTEDMDVSNKRKTLKARVKNLAADYKFPKDLANYISLFLLITKFIYVEEQTWKVSHDLVNKINNEDFLFDNLFKFLFFTRDYNEYYKSPLVFNTPYVNNDFDVVNKRKSIVKSLYTYCEEEIVSLRHDLEEKKELIKSLEKKIEEMIEKEEHERLINEKNVESALDASTIQIGRAHV